MLSSITPLGERSRGGRWPTTVGVFLVASVVGGVLVGALSSTLGTWLIPPSLPIDSGLLLGATAVVGAALDSHVLGSALPTWRRQVSRHWLDLLRPWAYATGFGLQLGFALVTIVTNSATYVFLLGAFISRDLTLGLLAGALFGLVRGSTVLAARHVDSPMRLAHLHQRLDRWGPRAKVTGVGAQAVTGVLLATTWVPN